MWWHQCNRLLLIQCILILLGLHISQCLSHGLKTNLRGRHHPRMKTAYACEDSTISISCKDQVIRIIRANYGRFSISVCNPHGVTSGWNLQCRSAKSVGVVAERYPYDTQVEIKNIPFVPAPEVVPLLNRCDGHNKCAVTISNHLFTDPCLDTFKYIEVHYYCEDEEKPRPNKPVKPQPTTKPSQHVVTRTTTAMTTHVPTMKPGPVTPFPRRTTSAATSKPVKYKPHYRKPDPPVLPDSSEPDDSEEPQPIALQFCKSEHKSGVQWPKTEVGQLAYMTCPSGKIGLGMWLCGRLGWVGHADMRECTSPWLHKIIQQLDSEPLEVVVNKIVKHTDRKVPLESTDLLQSSDILSKMMAKLEKRVARPEGHFLDDSAKTTAKHVTKSIVRFGSNILSPEQSGAWEELDATQTTKVASSLVATVENSAFCVADTMSVSEGGLLNIEENILLEVKIMDASEANIDLTLPSAESSRDQSQWRHYMDRITIPKENLQMYTVEGPVKVVFVAYNNLAEWMMAPYDPPPRKTSHSHTAANGHGNGVDESHNDTSSGPKWQINSNILTTSINDGKHLKSLVKPVTFTLQHTNVSLNFNPVCVHWNYSERTELRKWSCVGCKVVDDLSNQSHTTCQCNHLTTFAVLMDVAGTQLAVHHVMSLQVITFAGCFISIVCLLLCFITFSLFKNLQCDRNTIHKNLVFCLMIAEIVFLAGIVQHKHIVLCAVIAGFLHFFFLASFAWMCLEGIQLYVMLIEVFEAEKSRVKFYYLFGYGVPSLIVAIAAGVDPEGYGTETHCWLRTDTYFIWSFVGPVTAVISSGLQRISPLMCVRLICKFIGHSLRKKPIETGEDRTRAHAKVIGNFIQNLNIVMLSIAMYMMCRHAATVTAVKAKEQSRLQKYSARNSSTPLTTENSSEGLCHDHVEVREFKKSSNIALWIRGAVVLVVLLGLTWSLGIVFLNEETVALAYLFTILNSLQGVFIFLFHCIINEKVQKEYRKVARRTAWFPDCIRIGYGGYNRTSHSTSPNHSSSTGGNYFSKFWRRKRPSSTLFGKGSPTRKARPDSDSSLLTPGSNPNRFSFPSQSNGNAVRYQPNSHNDGIVGDLSMIDCSIVDSEFVTEYCQENLKVQNDSSCLGHEDHQYEEIDENIRMHLKNTIKGEDEDEDDNDDDIEKQELNKNNVYENDDDCEDFDLSMEKNCLSYNSDDLIIKKLPSPVICTDLSDADDDERCGETITLMSGHADANYSFAKVTESERNLLNNLPHKATAYHTLESQHKTSISSLENYNPASASGPPEAGSVHLIEPNLMYKDDCASRHKPATILVNSSSDCLNSLPNLSIIDEATERENGVAHMIKTNTVFNNAGMSVTRHQSDIQTKHDPHRYPLSSNDSVC